MKVGIQVDPVSQLKSDDSTTLLAEMAVALGYDVFRWTHKDVSMTLEGAVVQATQWDGAAPTVESVVSFDVIMVRENPPMTEAKLAAGYLLEASARSDTLFVNSPRAIRDVHAKLICTHFPELAPKTIVTSVFEVASAFSGNIDRVVVKPLNEFGGAGIFITKSNARWRARFDAAIANFGGPLMIQEFLPEVSEGDKRVVVVGGEPIGALLRLPKEEGALANLSQGGRAEIGIVDGVEQRAIAAMAPMLEKVGAFLVGVDFIGGRVTEVNVISPGALFYLESFSEKIAATFWSKIAEQFGTERSGLPDQDDPVVSLVSAVSR